MSKATTVQSGIINPMPPIEIYLCTTEEDLKHIRKKCDWDIQLEVHAFAEAMHWEVLNTEKEEEFSVVYMPMSLTSVYDRVTIDSYLVHEAAHVVDAYYNRLGEDVIGKEAYAYTVQAVSFYLISEFHSREHYKATNKK